MQIWSKENWAKSSEKKLIISSLLLYQPLNTEIPKYFRDFFFQTTAVGTTKIGQNQPEENFKN